MEPPPPYVAGPSQHAGVLNTPAADAAREVFNRLKPFPQDRRDYYAPLEVHPLLETHPFDGRWIILTSVKPLEDGSGWIAELAATPTLVNQGTGIARVAPSWVERYEYRNGVLTYLGGRSDQPRAPYIGVGTY